MALIRRGCIHAKVASYRKGSCIRQRTNMPHLRNKDPSARAHRHVHKVLEQVLRHLRGLAAARFTAEQRHLMVVDMVDNVLSHVMNRQPGACCQHVFIAPESKLAPDQKKGTRVGLSTST